jgi:hypothetical protein
VKNVYSIIVRSPEGKTPLGRSRHGLEDNNAMDHKEIVCEHVGWIHLVGSTDELS